MKTKPASFKFTVPGDPSKAGTTFEDENGNQVTVHAEAGREIEKSFEYSECETDEEAAKVLADRKLSVRNMVNKELKSNARANAYQAALLPYKQSDVPLEDIRERTIRDFIRMGLSEQDARNLVNGATSLSSKSEAPQA